MSKCSIIQQLKEDLRELDRCRIREDIKECLSMSESDVLRIEAKETFTVDFFGEVLECERV